jgi:hypothetical protein
MTESSIDDWKFENFSLTYTSEAKKLIKKTFLSFLFFAAGVVVARLSLIQPQPLLIHHPESSPQRMKKEENSCQIFKVYGTEINGKTFNFSRFSACQCSPDPTRSQKLKRYPTKHQKYFRRKALVHTLLNALQTAE